MLVYTRVLFHLLKYGENMRFESPALSFRIYFFELNDSIFMTDHRLNNPPSNNSNCWLGLKNPFKPLLVYTRYINVRLFTHLITGENSVYSNLIFYAKLFGEFYFLKSPFTPQFFLSGSESNFMPFCTEFITNNLSA